MRALAAAAIPGVCVSVAPSSGWGRAIGRKG